MLHAFHCLGPGSAEQRFTLHRVRDTIISQDIPT
jgi:hypothetical protein